MVWFTCTFKAANEACGRNDGKYCAEKHEENSMVVLAGVRRSLTAVVIQSNNQRSDLVLF